MSSEFENNTAASWGGAIYVGGKSKDIEIADSFFKGNSGSSVGGAIAIDESEVTAISRCVFVANKCQGGYGGYREFGRAWGG